MKRCSLVDKIFQNLMSVGKKTLRGFYWVVVGFHLFGGFTEAHEELNSVGNFFLWAKTIRDHFQIYR